MSAIAIEVADAGLLAAGAHGLVGEASPGYAHLAGSSVLTGSPAFARARMEPRRIHNRFWDRLDTTALVAPFPRSLTHADLVHGHLAGFWKSLSAGVDSVTLAVPATFTGQQLGLLAGIGRAAGVPVQGLIDSALAAVAGLPEEDAPSVLHVDLLLHRALVTEINGRERLHRARVRIGEKIGLAALRDAWARVAAEAFVRQTRFDPLHLAESDQELYDRLPGWLEALADAPSLRASLSWQGREKTAEITRAEILSAAEPAYGHLTEVIRPLLVTDPTPKILLSARAGSLPGLAERLSGLAGGRLGVLEPGAAALGAYEWRAAARSRGEALSLVTRLSRAGGRPDASPAPSPEPARQESDAGVAVPTHLLHRSRAHPILDEPLTLGLSGVEGARSLALQGPTAGVSRIHCTVARKEGRAVVTDHSTWGTFVNGRRVDGEATLAVGDRLRLGSPGIELELIRVEAADGQA